MKRKVFSMLLIIMLIACFPILAFADDNAVDTGDTTFIMISAAMVFFMTPGLALFYGGMSRKKNVLNTIMNVVIVIGIVSIQWVLFGYSLSFGDDNYSIVGGFNFLGFNNVGSEASGTIPHTVFALYQMMFAIITAALITGAFAGRMRFTAMMAFILFWTTLVYDPIAHWVWHPEGWLFKLGALDFAGGNVVHISSGIAGLVAAITIGKRKNFGKTPNIPHNLTLVIIGTAILWFGWFGFNAGSALSANGLAANAFLVTNTSAAAALLSWVVIEYIHHGKATVLGAATGAVVGLVAITPAAGFVNPLCSIIIGLLVSPICYFAISYLKPKLGYDDTLDAFGCHGIGGIWGAIATGLFASKSVNPNGADGLFFGNPSLLLTQLISVIATILLSGIFTFVILKAISLFTKLRVSDKEEDEGLDISLHGEDAYPDFSTEEGIAL